MLIWIIGFALIAAVGSIAAASLILLFPIEKRKKVLPWLISYATGTLLGASFLGLLPEAMETLSNAETLGATLVGIILFFILEKLIIWRHCHQHDCDAHNRAGVLIMVGDSVHNFIDGIVIAMAFLVSVPLGIATAFAVISHEIPQEVGDFAILIESGYTKKKAFLFNLFSSFSTLVGGILGYFFLSSMEKSMPYLMAVSAASFIYVAVADLFPNLHKYTALSHTILQILFIVLGVFSIVLIRSLSHSHSH
ncbi:MAG: ZIP family metal transporter [Spirochaetia bacterium]|nr:ZIP family metal transporter [Spirochaetia bacterium]